jgi:hypothetical protein
MSPQCGSYYSYQVAELLAQVDAASAAHLLALAAARFSRLDAELTKLCDQRVAALQVRPPA